MLMNNEAALVDSRGLHGDMSSSIHMHVNLHMGRLFYLSSLIWFCSILESMVTIMPF